MPEWLQSSDYAAALLWVIGALVLLIAVLVLVRLIRSMTFGTFVAGGRNRKTRLAVMDATAVDSHRRLVLIRRDDVEHLVLIGGPTDVVVEQNIKFSQSRRPVLAGEPPQEAAPRSQRPAEQRSPMPQAAPTTPVSAPPTTFEQRFAEPRQQKPLPSLQSLRAALQPEQAPPLHRASWTAVEPPFAPAPVENTHPLREAQSTASVRNGSGNDLDKDQPYNSSKAPNNPPRPAAKEGPSLEDEMNRLLGELSSRF